MCQQLNYVIPNYLIPKALVVYACFRMARRRQGKLEERLRAGITAQVRGRQGKNKELAEQIGRPGSWVSEYMGGENHASLDTSLALMRFLGWRLNEDLTDFVVDQTITERAADHVSGTKGVDPIIARAVSDPATAVQAKAFLEFPTWLRGFLLQAPEFFAQAGIELPKGQALESKSDSQEKGGTRLARSRRR